MSKYKLTSEEKAYIISLIKNTRLTYLKNMQSKKRELLTNFLDESFYKETCNIDNLIIINTDEINYTSLNLEDSFYNEKLSKIFKNLTQQEKDILYDYYNLGYTDKEIAYKSKMKVTTVSSIRKRSGYKIRDYLKES